MKRKGKGILGEWNDVINDIYMDKVYGMMKI